MERTETKAPESKVSSYDWQRPLYDVSEDKDAFQVRVSLPGVSRDGLEISLEEDTLTVVGTRAAQLPEAWRPLRREISTGNYRLSLRLNVPVNEAQIQAHIADGVLDLSLPKADEVKPRKIHIS
jgi:HSP20 family protein